MSTTSKRMNRRRQPLRSPFGHIDVDEIEERMIGCVQPSDGDLGRAMEKACGDACGKARIRCGATIPSSTHLAVPKSGGRILARTELALARKPARPGGARGTGGGEKDDIRWICSEIQNRREAQAHSSQAFFFSWPRPPRSRPGSP